MTYLLLFQATEIGKSVAALRGHSSLDIKKFSKRLVQYVFFDLLSPLVENSTCLFVMLEAVFNTIVSYLLLIYVTYDLVLILLVCNAVVGKSWLMNFMLLLKPLQVT